jgi:predicted component of type VI protein secretion system
MMKHELQRPAALAPVTLCAALSLALTGCISVKTPEKPIEINLNVNIKQEVLVRLQRDVEQLINQNPQAFPQTPPKP